MPLYHVSALSETPLSIRKLEVRLSASHQIFSWMFFGSSENRGKFVAAMMLLWRCREDAV